MYPLSGTKVVETTSGVAGPLCGKLLADAGATVTSLRVPANDPRASRRRHATGRTSSTSARTWFQSTQRSPTDGSHRRLLAEADLYLTSARHDPERERGLDCHLVLDRFHSWWRRASHSITCSRFRSTSSVSPCIRFRPLRQASPMYARPAGARSRSNRKTPHRRRR